MTVTNYAERVFRDAGIIDVPTSLDDIVNLEADAFETTEFEYEDTTDE
jgi:hypothetical protein